MNHKPKYGGYVVTRHGIIRAITSYTKTWKRNEHGKVVMG